MIDTSAYDHHAVTSAAMPRALMSPLHNMPVSYSTACTGDMVSRQALPQHGLYNYSYNPAANDDLFAMDYVQRRPQPQTLDSPTGHLSSPYSRPSPRQSFASEQESEDYTYVKPEPRLTTATPSWNHTSPSQFPNTTTTSTNSVVDVNFGTDVDTLMRAIQSKLHSGSSDTPPPPPIKAVRPAVQQSRNVKYPQCSYDQEKPHDDHHRKRHECHVGSCRKAFVQRTHLEIHIRAHTGVKPYTCHFTGCTQSFSQLGNLRTHERRHSGERPYACDVCGKTFSQRGSVRAHRSVHDAAKPFTCKLDACGKRFTQLGNLKSHQNKFHDDALRALTRKFADIRTGDAISRADRELFTYFATLYKNSNKGIKGRGKGRRVASAAAAAAAAEAGRGAQDHHGLVMQELGDAGGYAGYAGYAGYERRVAYAYEYGFVGGPGSVGGASQGGSSATGSVCGGSSGGEAYEDEGRELAFGDRLY